MRKLVALPLLLALAACGESATDLGPAPKAQASGLQSAPTNQKVVALKIWLVRGKGLVARTRTHPQTVRVATAAMQELLAGPRQEERRSALRTAIPGGTRLLGIGIDNGVATVDLSSEFQAGGGSESLQLRLAQVVYTLTQFPTVQRVQFELDGSPVSVLSNRGDASDHPVGRKDYGDPDCAGIPTSRQGFIVVNSPRSGDRVASGFVTRGCSSAFEGTLNWNLKTGDGAELASGFVQGGSSEPGAFAFSVEYQLARSGSGVLEVYEPPASGEGGPTSRVTVPVELAARR
jgi:germination protein M